MKKILVVLLALFLGGCDTTVPVDVTFAVYNTSDDPIQTVVSGRDAGPQIAPNGSRQFRVSIEVPSRSGGYSTAPQDQVVTVSVAIRNLRTGNLTDPAYCSATARQITDVTYQVNLSWDGVSCW